MINLNVKKDNDKTVAEYILKENDRIDNLTLGMLVNNDIEGVVSVFPVQVDKDRFFRYDITNKVTMREYLGEYVKKERLLKSFYSIAKAIRESTEYIINWTSFSLDIDEIYIDEDTDSAELICLPLLTVINDGNLCNFFKSILFMSQFDSEESSDYVGRLVNFLNPKTYTLDNFILELEEMLGIKQSVEPSAKAAEEEPDKEEPSAKAAAEEEPDKGEPSVKATEEEPDKEEPSVKATEEEPDKEEPSEKEEASSDVPFLVRLADKKKIVIDKEVFYIGKDSEQVDYCIEDNETVDDKHAYFVRHGKEYFVVGNGTKGRTYLNSVDITDEEETFIPHGAHISFGTEEFEFRMHE